MKAIYAKFFQGVQLHKGDAGTEIVMSANSKDYNMKVKEPFLLVQHVSGGPIVATTLNNICYIRTDLENLNEQTASSAKDPGKTKKEQN